MSWRDKSIKQFGLLDLPDAWKDSVRLYHELNGGRLYGSIKVIKMPEDRDIADLRGDIEEYHYEIR